MPRKNRQSRTVRRDQMRKSDRWVVRVVEAVMSTPGLPSDVATTVASGEVSK